MMDLRAFLTQLHERAQQDPALREEMQRDLEGVLARESGATPAEVRQYLQGLSDEELSGIAGGVQLLGAGPGGPATQMNDDPGPIQGHLVRP